LRERDSEKGAGGVRGGGDFDHRAAMGLGMALLNLYFHLFVHF